MIRPATLADREKIFDLLIVEMERYPLKPDIERINFGLTESISSARNFAWVSEIGGEIRGVLIGLTGGNLWAQRSHCTIVAWMSTIPGDGAQLLRTLVEWVRGRRDIRVAGMTPDLNGVDERAWELAERIGFEKHGGAYLLYN